MINTTIATGVMLGGALFFYYRRSLRYLKYFQQEDYTSGRFFRWIIEKRVFDTRGLRICIGTMLVAYALHDVHIDHFGLPIVTAFGAAALIAVALAEEDPRKSGKIKLNMTARLKRIFYLSLALYVAVNFAVAYFCLHISDGDAPIYEFVAAQLLLIQLHPAFIMLANTLLMPYEKSLQEGFANEARALIKKYDPTVIGITGSYGKTSTKIILREILSSVSPTFVPPGSINSYMGVTREIREKLKPEHKYAVIEMGAYYIGSIKRMCSLTPPKAAIVTAIGIMHLERFGGQDSVYIAKSELPQAVPQDGILVVNGDDERCRRIAQENPKATVLLYGTDTENEKLDAVIYDIRATDKGSEFKIRWKGEVYEGFTPLLGRPLLANALAAFTLACALGIAPNTVISALRNAKTEKNRLEPVRVPISSFKITENGNQPPEQGEVLRLNDAYNSNPIGFAAALDVLGQVQGGRKILVTPGMIELGDRQEQENKMAAKKAASVCDLVIVVGDTNRKALTEGLREGGLATEKCQALGSMTSAFDYLSGFCKDGDVVLIENDLGDLYEGRVRF